VNSNEKRATEQLLSEMGQPDEVVGIRLKSAKHDVFVYEVKTKSGKKYCTKMMSPRRADYHPIKRLATVATSHAMMRDGHLGPKSLGVVIVNSDRCTALPDMSMRTRIIQVLEFMPIGTKDSYAYMLRRCIKKEPDEGDITRLTQIVDALVSIHSRRTDIDDRRKRQARYRESLTDVGSHALRFLSKFHANDEFVPLKMQQEILSLMFAFIQQWKKKWQRLRTLHGDFHPGNQFFRDENVVVLDHSRVMFGEPAIDVAWFITELLWLHYGAKYGNSGCNPTFFNGLIVQFLQLYEARTGDKEVRAALCFTLGLTGAIKVWTNRKKSNPQLLNSFLGQILHCLRKMQFDWE
jgi:hypothetical protein